MRPLTLVLLLGFAAPSAALAQDQPQPDQVQKVGPGVHAPVAIRTPEASMPVEAVERKINGVCAASLIVDTKGDPTHIQIVRCTNRIFAENALAAVSDFRFKPATRAADGASVPVRITVEIAFRLTDVPFNEAELWAPWRVRYDFSPPPGVTSPEPGPDGAYPLTKQLEAPQIVGFVSDGLGDAAKSLDENTDCHLLITIDAKGKAENPDSIDCSQEKMKKRVVNSLMQSKYTPAKLNGKAVAVRLQVHFIYMGVKEFQKSLEGDSETPASQP